MWKQTCSSVFTLFTICTAITNNVNISVWVSPKKLQQRFCLHSYTNVYTPKNAHWKTPKHRHNTYTQILSFPFTQLQLFFFSLLFLFSCFFYFLQIYLGWFNNFLDVSTFINNKITSAVCQLQNYYGFIRLIIMPL